jgi:hypothetical protein
MADLQNFAYGILIFSLAVSCLVYFSDDMFSFYSTPVDAEYRSVYDHIENNIDSEANRTKDMQQKVEQTEINTGFFQQVSLITDVITSALKLPFQTAWGVITTISIIFEKIGLPSFLTKGIFAIVILTITFAILNWIFIRRVR